MGSGFKSIGKFVRDRKPPSPKRGWPIQLEDIRVRCMRKKKRKPSIKERLKARLRKAKEREALLRYVADTVIKHYFKDASIEEVFKVLGGVRARKMLRALKVLYKWPKKFEKDLRGKLEATIFHKKLEARNKRLKKEGQKPPDVMGLQKQNNALTDALEARKQLDAAVRSILKSMMIPSGRSGNRGKGHGKSGSRIVRRYSSVEANA